MKQQTRPLLRRIAKTMIAAQGIMLVAAPAAWAARSANYGFTMEHRYVSGRDNGIMHQLDGGLIDNTGDLWMTSRDGGSKDAPFPVHIQVFRDGGLFDLQLCETLVEPAPRANLRVPYAEECGKHPGDSYYIVAYKVEDDGWNIQGSGTLNSRPVPNGAGGVELPPIEPQCC